MVHNARVGEDLHDSWKGKAQGQVLSESLTKRYVLTVVARLVAKIVGCVVVVSTVYVNLLVQVSF